MSRVNVGPTPTRLVCPSCNTQIVTKIKHVPNTKTHIIAMILCLCVCWPCVCVPYLVDACQNANHYCPNCNAYIGTYEA